MSELTAQPGVIYGRQSKGKEASIEDQLAVGRERAEEEGGLVLAVLSDEVSASRHTASARTDWPKLVELVRERKVRWVWLWEASRGDRKAAVWLSFLDECASAGVVLYIETDERTYDPDVARDWKVLATAGVDADVESAVIKARTLRGKRRARRAGDLRKVLGGKARYGWQATEAGWEVEPQAAEVLAEVARRVIAGEKLGAVFSELAPLPADSYGEPVDYKRLRATLLMPVTGGMLAGTDGELSRVVEEAPLDERTWRVIQGIYAGRKRGRPAEDRYPFGPLLRCMCGNQLNGEVIYRGKPKREGGEPTPYYQCKVRHKRADGTYQEPCGGVAVSTEELHAYLRSLLEEWAEVAPEAHAVAREQLDLTGQAAGLAAQMAELEEWMADLVDKRNARRLTPARYAQAAADLEAQMAAVEAQQRLLDAAAVEARPLSFDWDGMTPAERARWVARVFVTPIVVKPRRAGARTLEDRVELHYRKPATGAAAA